MDVRLHPALGVLEGVHRARTARPGGGTGRGQLLRGQQHIVMLDMAGRAVMRAQQCRRALTNPDEITG